VAQGKLDIEERRKEEIESAVQRAEMHKRIETRKRRNEARAARKAEEAKRAAAEAKQLKEKQVFALKVSEAVNVRLQKTCKKLNSSKEPCNCACCALLDGTKKKFCIKYCGTSKQADRVSCY